MSQFSLSAMKRIFKDQDQTKRVSEDSCKELRSILEDRADEVAKRAIEYAEEDGIQTVRPKHIREALGDLS